MIEWTATVHADGTVTPGKTWNPVTGCTKVSTGCKYCYAEAIAHRFWGDRVFSDVRLHEDRLFQPLSWRKPTRVFVNSMSDLFHEDVPDWFLDRVFAVMAHTQQHTFQVLTKRPDRMREYLSAIDPATEDSAWPLPNVWLGVSCENQETADARLPLLLDTPAAVRFVSCEPMLGPIDLERYLLRPLRAAPGVLPDLPRLDWVICGGESGPRARPCDLAWVRAVVQQCQAAGVPVFVKQLGSHPDGCHALKNTKGGDPSEWPADLRVRQWPTTDHAPTR